MMPSEEVLYKPNEMVQVVVRSRPINEEEEFSRFYNVVKVVSSDSIVQIYDPKHKKLDHCKNFVFDSTYDFKSTNQEIYDKSVHPLVLAILKGFNGTIFAYGQSGSGKTYTLEGVDNDKGIIFETFKQIFVNVQNSTNTQYLILVSHLEIYKDEIRDLLKRYNTKCEIRENPRLGSYVKNLSSFVCKSVKQITTLFNKGRLNRVVGETDMNKRSSRSHSVLTITVETRCTENPKHPIRVGKLNLVDLAGSERQKKTNAEGKRLKEATKINLSLTALGNVISALSNNRDQVFIPYRDSKLTRLLKNSLGGNSKTLMIANIGPANCSYDESLNTLRFASKARNIKNQPVINEDPIDALLRKYQEEIEKLKNQLAEREETRHRQKMRIKIKDKSPKVLEQPTLKIHNDQMITTSDVETSESQESLIEIQSTCSTEQNISDQNYIDDLLKRIEAMESKILTGSSNLLEHTWEQQQALAAKSEEIKKIEKREKEVQKLIVFQVQSTEETREGYTSLKDEVEDKSDKLLKMMTTFKNIQQEITEAKEEFNEDRRDLDITEHELLKDLQLRFLLMENFIPNLNRRKVLSRFKFDKDLDEWKVTLYNESSDIYARPKSAEELRRPMSMFALISQRKVNHTCRCNRTQENLKKTFRFKAENLLQLNLYKFSFKVKNYTSLQLGSKFKIALKEEENITIDAADYTLCKKSDTMKVKTLAPQLLQPKELIKKPVYPKARGLVPK